MKEKFNTSKIVIEKKWESNDQIWTGDIPILADINKDCIPELIMPGNDYKELLIIDSKTGFTKLKISIPFLEFDISGITITVADIDSDGIPEIFLKAGTSFLYPSNIRGKLMCYNMDGSIRWVSDQKVDSTSNDDISGKLALADFNQDGIPEIYISNKIFNALTGIKLMDGGTNGLGREIIPNSFNAIQPISIAAQLDEDSTDLELAAGFTIYKVKIVNPNGMLGNRMTAMNIKVDSAYRDGFTTIGDINLDGRLDVIVTSPGYTNEALVYAYNLANGVPKLLAKAYPPSLEYTGIGPALISDIKGLGKPSIVFTRYSKLLAYSYNGTNLLQLDWDLITTDSSGFTGLTTFDFNNDGIQEIVYRDMTNLSIIDGSGAFPKVITKIACFSPTWNEYPIIGDIDHSGNSKICVPCSSSTNESLGKLTIFGPPDSLPGWAPARGIWNQYNYHVLNINDDLTVPRVEKNNATYKNGRYNNFYVQESLLDENGMYNKPAASLWGAIQCIHYDPATDLYTVIFDLYNKNNASMNADSALPVAFYNGNPETNGTLIDVYLTKVKLGAGDTLKNQSFTFSATNLNQLFLVVNTKRNGGGSFNPSDYLIPECDYTDNLFQTIDLPTIQNTDTSICKGADFRFYDTILHNAGRYYHKINNVRGCDSLIVVLNMALVDSVHTNQFLTVCDSYSWNGNKYLASGDYVFDTLNSFGCDSLITLHLLVNKSSNSDSVITACNSYIWNGQAYAASGTYSFQTMNAAGCDSLATLNLDIHHADTTIIIKAACDSYTWNGVNYTQTGNYSYVSQNKADCDSTIILQLTIDTIILSSMTQTSCDSYVWGQDTLTTSGNYSLRTLSSNGCDSIARLALTIHHASSSNAQITACDSFVWNGINYTASGSYLYKSQNTTGCDSIATLDLIIFPSSNSITDVTSCDNFFWNGQTYTVGGNYSYKTQNALGCDSIAVLQLHIHKSDTLEVNQTACDTFTWNHQTFTESGTYENKTLNIAGCDSLTKLNLILNKSSRVHIALSACDSLLFLGKKLDSNGTYLFTIPNAAGCDSTINLGFTRLSTNQTIIATACDSFLWNANGQIYNQPGFYIASFINSSGCDSTYSLNLNLNKSYQFVQQTEVCNEYVWPVNHARLTQSGTYNYPLKTAEGCDSIFRLNLIVNPDYEKTDTVITNNDFTWTVNNQTYSVSGTYRKQFISTSGCDSIHFLYLIINKDVEIYFPNVINTNGLNNKFTLFIYGSEAMIESLSIYDRWGELVWQKQHFAPNDLQLGWDGKFKEQYVLPGVYVWHASISAKNGDVIRKKGDLTVVR